MQRQGDSARELAAELDEKELGQDGEKEDAHADRVGEKTFKNVKILAEFSAIDFVEKLAHDKNVEDQGAVFNRVRGDSEQHGLIENGEIDNELEDGLSQDVQPHSLRDKGIIFSVWFSIEKFRRRRVS